jgi:hypothetical protein
MANVWVSDVETFLAKDPVIAGIANLAPKPSFLLSDRLQKRVIQENADPESSIRWRVRVDCLSAPGDPPCFGADEPLIDLCRSGYCERLMLLWNDKESN